MRYIGYIHLCLLIPFTSCNFFDQEINMELPEHDSRIVVNAVAERGSEEIRLAITRSIGMRDSSSYSQPLPDPRITLTINGNTYNDFKLDSAGHQVLPVAINSGDQLTLKVEAAGFEPVFSETVVPEPPLISEVKIGGSVFDFGGSEKREISFVIADIPSEDNYFKVSFIQDRDSDYYFGGISLESPITWVSYVWGGLAFTDVIFKDGKATITVWVDEYLLSRKSEQISNFLQVETLDKSYYDYQTTYYTHHYNQQPDLFGGEPVPMVNNIKGGYGLFSSSAKVKFLLEEE